jgi:hypothetical protein
MSSINQLSAADEISLGDLFVLFSTSNGEARKAAGSLLISFIEENINLPATPQFVTQYAAPSASGFSVAVAEGVNTHLILTPTGGFLAGTIVLPEVSTCVDSQEFLVNCTQAITGLTVNGNGALAVTGEPAGMAANDFFRLKFDLPTQSWYRVG